MNEDVGKNIKVFAKIIGYVVLLVSVILGVVVGGYFAAWSGGHAGAILIGFLVGILVGVVLNALMWCLYGFGQMIDDTRTIMNTVAYISELIEYSLPDTEEDTEAEKYDDELQSR